MFHTALGELEDSGKGGKGSWTRGLNTNLLSWESPLPALGLSFPIVVLDGHYGPFYSNSRRPKTLPSSTGSDFPAESCQAQEPQRQGEEPKIGEHSWASHTP